MQRDTRHSPLDSRCPSSRGWSAKIALGTGTSWFARLLFDSQNLEKWLSGPNAHRLCTSRFSVAASPSPAARSRERNPQVGVSPLCLQRFVLPVTVGRQHRDAERVSAQQGALVCMAMDSYKTSEPSINGNDFYIPLPSITQNLK